MEADSIRSRLEIADALNVIYAVTYHEAGHAVAAFIFGRKVEHISLHLEDTSRETLAYVQLQRPRCLTSQTSDSRLEGQVIRELMINLAGPLAESKYSGLPIGPTARDDLTDAKMLALRICNHAELDTLFAWIELRVRLLLDNPSVWCQVVALAEALLFLEGELMPGHLARRICKRAEATRKASRQRGTSVRQNRRTPR